MNYNKNVVVFTLVSTIILFLYSLFAVVYHPHLLSLDNISIISDVVKARSSDSGKDEIALTGDSSLNAGAPVAVTDTGTLPPRSLAQYHLSKNITSFATDTALPALPGVMHKIYELRKGNRKKVRIAWLGDSMIEGDLLTQTFRKKLQQLLGGSGVGFVPATSVTAAFRSTVSHKWSGDWKEENFKTTDLSGPLFLSGHLFYNSGGSLHLRDNTVKDSTQPLEKSFICGQFPGNFNINVNGVERQVHAPKKINRIVLDSSAGHSIDITIGSEKVPVYGISFEPVNGVVVDNFSFRGITGLELGKLDTAFLQAIQEENTYDLVVLEYGANLMFRPNDSDYSWFQKHIIPVIKRLQLAMPGAEFLVISTSDRAFKYGDNWQTALGINKLIRSQAELAYGNGAAFFNMYKSMGGAGTIVRWADSSSPSLANKDYIHPNQRGAEILGNIFFDAFMKDYNKQEIVEQDRENFTITAANAIIDKRTNLEWYIADDKDYAWPEANDWISNLSIDKCKWSLPTPEQVLTLYNSHLKAGNGIEYNGGQCFARISPVFNRIGHGAWVWTSENIDPEKAYTINLNKGIKVETQKNTVSYPVRVLAVRKLNSQNN